MRLNLGFTMPAFIKYDNHWFHSQSSQKEVRMYGEGEQLTKTKEVEEAGAVQSKGGNWSKASGGAAYK